MSIDKAAKKVAEYLNESAARAYLAQFERIQKLPGANSAFERIASAADKETLLDYLAEVRYILVFVGLGFQVDVEPFGKEGADLRVSRDGHRAVVEITRFRPVHPGPPFLDLSDEMACLPEYGNVKRDIRKAIRKIYRKFSQIGDDESIIAIWNDDEDMEEIEVEAAVNDLRNEASLPGRLAFVIYGSKWIGNRQLYCFPLRHQAQPHQALWQQEISASTVNDLIHRALGGAG